ncbi:MAG: hypothetical protein ACKO2G_16435 [Verrucomicrobiales bacterium]
MGRPETAAACAKALAGQTMLPSMLVVACNDPADGTMEGLRALEPLPFQLVLHPMATNRGNAGGVEEAMAIALQHGCEACWILDDDSWPEPAALEILCAAREFPDDIPHPLQIDPIRRDLSWPVALIQGGKKAIFRRMDLLPAGDRHISVPVWTGTLVGRSLIAKAGPVPGELFIRGEDDEYSDRLQKAGARFLFVPAARLTHPGPVGLRELRIAGKSFFWDPNVADWKLYYLARNRIWRTKRQGIISTLAVLFITMFCIFRHDRKPFRRLGILWLAATHAFANHLGRLSAPWAP